MGYLCDQFLQGPECRREPMLRAAACSLAQDKCWALRSFPGLWSLLLLVLVLLSELEGGPALSVCGR